jgi:hypothetical protein
MISGLRPLTPNGPTIWWKHVRQKLLRVGVMDAPRMKPDSITHHCELSMKLRSVVTCVIAIDVAVIALSALASGLGAAVETAPNNPVEPGILLALGLALTTTGLLVRARDSLLALHRRSFVALARIRPQRAT